MSGAGKYSGRTVGNGGERIYSEKNCDIEKKCGSGEIMKGIFKG